MQLLKRFFDFILFGNIYVALGSVCLIQSTIHQLGFSDHLYSYCLLTFFATIFIYNLQRIFYKQTKIKKLNSIRRIWIFEHQTIIKVLALAGYIGLCLTFFSNNHRIIFYLLPLLILSVAYFLPVVKLRKSAGFKLFTLVTVWTLTTSAIPILLNGLSLFHKLEWWQLMLHIAMRFCFMMAICIPFDIRDIAIDAAEDVSTLAKMGESNARWIAVFFILIYCVLIILELATKTISIPAFIALLISMSATLFLILLSNSKRSEYYFVAGIDGTMILQGLLLIILA